MGSLVISTFSPVISPVPFVIPKEFLRLRNLNLTMNFSLLSAISHKLREAPSHQLPAISFEFCHFDRREKS